MAFKEKRERVEPGLYKTGKIYWACATAPGERRAEWKKLGLLGIQEARRERDKFAYKLKNGEIPLAAKRMTVRAVSTEWFAQLDELEASGELRPRTLTSYKGGIRLHLLPEWGGRDIGSIDADDLVFWRKRQRASGAADWSIRARWMSVRGLLAYAARMGYITSNPCELLVRRERPKPGRSKTRYLSETEIKDLLSHSTRDAKVINAMLVFSGVRVSELLGLTWGDIDFKENLIRIRFQMSRKGKRTALKTESGNRDVILMDELARLLRARKVAARFSRDEDLLIGNGIGRTLGYTRLRKAFAKAATDAKISGATPHTCRHTFASILIHQGASVEFVSDQLGHASTKTTWDIYVHLFRARDQAAAAKRELDAAFGHVLRAASEEPVNE
jgi:integrase